MGAVAACPKPVDNSIKTIMVTTVSLSFRNNNRKFWGSVERKVTHKHRYVEMSRNRKKHTEQDNHEFCNPHNKNNRTITGVKEHK